MIKNLQKVTTNTVKTGMMLWGYYERNIPKDYQTSHVSPSIWILPLVGAVGCSVPSARPRSLAPSQQGSAIRSDLSLLFKASQDIFRAGQFELAAVSFQKGYENAKAARENYLALRFVANLGSCRLAQQHSQEALRIFLEALELAHTSGQTGMAGVLETNVSSLYTGLGERDTAVRYAERALAHLRGKERAAYLPKLLIHMGTLRADQDRMPEAAALFRRGIDAADAAGDLDAYAVGWSRLGEAYLERRDLASAEAAGGFSHPETTPHGRA
jgi:tetratricopeptide (TPR) repeat protein